MTEVTSRAIYGTDNLLRTDLHAEPSKRAPEPVVGTNADYNGIHIRQDRYVEPSKRTPDPVVGTNGVYAGHLLRKDYVAGTALPQTKVDESAAEAAVAASVEIAK